ncbi:TIGR01777 family oxidoreductase [Bilophila sp.]|uniref:TIGR01777 family oxidoreductase n=1 Tax=Bilophila sp. TaxID=1929485 RepID=UPI003076EF8E
MRVVLLGGSGFIGRALTQALISRGDEAVVPTRHVPAITSPAGPEYQLWDGQDHSSLSQILNGADAVVNLLGENIAAKRWSPGQKERILSSRLLAGQALVIALQLPIVRPKIVIQASAIGYYGFWPESLSAPECTEDSPAGSGFLATATIQWERSTQQAEHLGLRRCIIRTAPVLGLGGGMLAKLLPVFQLGLGGPIGTGRQPFAWIHLDDEVAAILFLLDHEELGGPFNLVAPEQNTMNDFVQSLGRALKRPVWIPIPSPLLRLVFGDMADELLLAGQKVSPTRLLEHGFTFRRPTLNSALPL